MYATYFASTIVQHMISITIRLCGLYDNFLSQRMWFSRGKISSWLWSNYVWILHSLTSPLWSRFYYHSVVFLCLACRFYNMWVFLPNKKEKKKMSSIFFLRFKLRKVQQNTMLFEKGILYDQLILYLSLRPRYLMHWIRRFLMYYHLLIYFISYTFFFLRWVTATIILSC